MGNVWAKHFSKDAKAVGDASSEPIEDASNSVNNEDEDEEEPGIVFYQTDD